MVSNCCSMVLRVEPFPLRNHELSLSCATAFTSCALIVVCKGQEFYRLRSNRGLVTLVPICVSRVQNSQSLGARPLRLTPPLVIVLGPPCNAQKSHTIDVMSFHEDRRRMWVCPDTNVEQLCIILRTIAWPASCATRSRIEGLIGCLARKSSSRGGPDCWHTFQLNFQDVRKQLNSLLSSVSHVMFNMSAGVWY
jgi:hypothetical protein